MGVVLRAGDDLDRNAGLRAHPDHAEWVRVRGDLAGLMRLAAFNRQVGTSLVSLDDVPIDTVELALAWAAHKD